MTSFKNISFKAWAVAGACLAIILVSEFRLFENYELISYDIRYNLRPPQKVIKDIVIINIDDDTLSKLGQWPLPRDFHATMVSVLNALGVKMILFDLLFSEPGVYDEAFAQSMKEKNNVYLPQAFDIGERAKRARLPFEVSPVLSDVTPVLKLSARATGHINALIDPDGKTRRVPVFIRGERKVVPLLAFKAACDFLGLKADKIEFHHDRITLDGKLSLPVARGDELLVNYPGTWEKTFEHFSYFEILKSFVDVQEGRAPRLDLRQFKDKVCFIGLTATGTSDLRSMPLQNVYPMLGLQASLFNSVVQRKFIKDAGPLANTLINLLVFAAALFICWQLPPVLNWLGAGGLGVLYFIIAYVFLSLFGFWIDLFFPLFLIGVAYVGVMFYRFLAEIKKRELLEQELEIAQKIQQNFLPSRIPVVLGVSAAAFIKPAKFVGGDLYDIVKIDENKIGVFLGDVSGKGVPAALLMAQAISLFRIFVRQGLDCAEVLRKLNKELCVSSGGRFVAAIYLIIDAETRKVQVSSAGQGPLFLYRKKENRIDEIELSGNVPLGLMDDVAYVSVNFAAGAGDKVVVFSDGVSEARNTKGEEFGTDNVRRVMMQGTEASSERLLEAVKQAVFQFAGQALQHDDITLISLSFLK